MTSGTKTSLLSTAAVITLLLFTAPAFCQEPVNDPLAFTPTGDALWDTYAQAVLEQLPDATFPDWGSKINPAYLPDELLASWETEFSASPEYWQMRYWNAKLGMKQKGDFNWCDIKFYRETVSFEPKPISYLEEGMQFGVRDSVTEMLLYEERSCGLKSLWAAYGEGDITLEELQVHLGVDDETPIHLVIESQEFELAQALLQSCPDESWPWYVRTMKLFEYGEWEAGLSDLRSGNTAPQNRAPMPFPASYVVERVVNDESCGNNVAAGIVLGSLADFNASCYAYHTVFKDNLRNQLVRLSMGAPDIELEQWHYFSCRFGSMEGGGYVNCLISSALTLMWSRYLLIDVPEAFTIQEREALLKLRARQQRFVDTLFYIHKGLYPPIEDLEEQFKTICSSYGQEFQFGINLTINLDSKTFAPMSLELLTAKFLWEYEIYSSEYDEVHERAIQHFDDQANFNPATFSWPK